VEEAEQVLAQHIHQQQALSALFFPHMRSRSDSSHDLTYQPSITSFRTGPLTLATENTTLSSLDDDTSSLSSTSTVATIQTISSSSSTQHSSTTSSSSICFYLNTGQPTSPVPETMTSPSSPMLLARSLSRNYYNPP
jgi:hypothetical protein